MYINLTMAMSREYADQYMSYFSPRSVYGPYDRSSTYYGSYTTPSSSSISYESYKSEYNNDNVSTVFNPGSIQNALNLITTPSK